MTTRKKLQEIYDEIDWSYKKPPPKPGIDFQKLAEDLAKADPHRQAVLNKAGSSGVSATCQTCGWISQPTDSRTSLEEQVIEDGGDVNIGGQLSCPQCFAPLTPGGP